MSPAINGSSAIWLFKHSNAIRITWNRITFDFYTGLPHAVVVDFTKENNYSLVPVKKLNIPVESVVAGCYCMVQWE